MKEINWKVYARLAEFLSHCDKNNVDYYIVKTLIKKMEDFPDITIEQISFLANTTPASVTKLCKKLGYPSFKEMRHDIHGFSNSSMFNTLNQQTQGEALNDYIHQFHLKEHDITAQIINSLNLDLIQDISLKLKKCQKVTILSADYNSNIIALFREVLAMNKILLFDINRKNDEALIQDIVQESDCVFLTSLTAQWVKKHEALLHTFNKEVYIIASTDISGFQTIYPHKYSHLFESNYISQRYLQIVFILINYYLSH